MLIRLPTPPWNILSHFGFYKIAERMHKDLVLVDLAFNYVTEIDRFSFGSSDDHVVYNFATDVVQVYPIEKTAPVRRQNTDDDPVALFMAPAVDVNRLPDVAHKPSSEGKRDYRRYRGIVKDEAGQ